jgi:outer membrane protein assembly factor BamD (BamD/ComL family)
MLTLLILMLLARVNAPDTCKDMNQVRESYGNIRTEQELTRFLELLASVDCQLTGPYEASATMQKAQFALAPWTQYNYFRKGKKMLEDFIKKYPANVEARYVRFLIQTHAPFFLGYHHEIKTDAAFIRENISGEDLSLPYQKEILNNLDRLEKK